MEIRDLRIGNWVNYCGAIDFVTVINTDDENFEFINTTSYSNISLEDIKPIPLTEEILKKFDFHCLGKKRNWFDKEFINGYDISINLEGKISLGRFGVWQTMPFNKIEFAHELQNFWQYHTKEELTFKTELWTFNQK